MSISDGVYIGARERERARESERESWSLRVGLIEKACERPSSVHHQRPWQCRYMHGRGSRPAST
jgi:hypothetical protein